MRKTISCNLEKTEGNPAALAEVIQRIIPKIADELTGSLIWYSQNAQYVPESIKIISIEYLGESRYKMAYSFRWSLFNACLDIDAEETLSETVNFHHTGDALVFDFIDTEPASAADEF